MCIFVLTTTTLYTKYFVFVSSQQNSSCATTHGAVAVSLYYHFYIMLAVVIILHTTLSLLSKISSGYSESVWDVGALKLYECAHNNGGKGGKITHDDYFLLFPFNK